MIAMIIGCRRNGLGLIRSLGSEGVHIIGVDVKPAPGLYSKYVTQKVIEPNLDGDALITTILNVAKNYSEKIYLIPTNDGYLDTLSRNFQMLAQDFIPVFETRSNILKACIEKSAMYRMADSAKVPYPMTFRPPFRDMKNIPLPAIVKPDQRKTLPPKIERQVFRIRFCQSIEEVKEAALHLEHLGVSYVVQKYIDGGDSELYTAGIFAFEGKLHAIGTARKLRQFPPRTGECSYGELIQSDKLEEYVTKFVSKSGITGICQVEFKKHNEEFYLMEINPRPWSWNSLITYAGVNLPHIALKVLSGRVPNECQRMKKTKGTWMFLLQDIKYNFLKHRNVGLLELIGDVMRNRRFAHFSISDPLPFFAFLYHNGLLRKKL